MFPPETTQTTYPRPAFPAIAAATDAAPAPSAIVRFRTATTRTASATSASVETNDPARRPLASGHISGSTLFPPIPSTKLARYSTETGRPAASDAAKGAAVSTSASDASGRAG